MPRLPLERRINLTALRLAEQRACRYIAASLENPNMHLRSIPLSECEAFGHGVKRPEDVVVSRDGTVWLSDQDSACARVNDDGTLSRVGQAGGAPNGINMDARGRIVIANFGGPEDGAGPLQRLDPASGEIEVICDTLDGKRLFGCNYPVVDSRGRIWCSHSTFGPLDDAFNGLDDGAIFRVEVDGTATLLADGIRFANGITLDADEQFLYVCETTGCDVIRYRINDDGSLGALEHYGPKLGFDNHEVQNQRPLSLELRSQLGLTDGCGFDSAGNLWVTLVLANKVVAITPELEVVDVLSDPEGKLMRNPTNVTWGGDDLCDLYIGSVSTDYVIKTRSPVPGLPMIHQR
ncbi:MAG: SMP-30/gluconolactonase/LRE family protein [Gammaproteobacteria bacterium]